MRILVIDDEDTIRFVIRHALSIVGMEVLDAESAEQGLQILVSRPDVNAVVLDLRLPGMSGTVACGKIKEIAPSMPVIISSGFVSEMDEEVLTKCGVRAILKKPYPIELLVEKLQALSPN